VLRELITRPISSFVALLELPRTMERSMREANELMEASRRQVESMRRQADDALHQAERMNDLLARIVKLTEPIEKAQRGGELAAGLMKRVILGEEADAQRIEEVVEQAEQAAAEASEPEDPSESSERPEPLK
jgi:methyl-accepting chemotaxis protein